MSLPLNERAQFFHGVISQIRVSNGARYQQDFTPVQRFEKDEHTLALYHFDEGTGDVLHDSSGNGHHGTIVGAKWVRVDESDAATATVWEELLPTDAPPPAIAPFNAEQAKNHQQAWADYLSVPVEKEVVVGKDNDGKDVTLTMILIPSGEFMMGSSEEEQAEFIEVAKVANDLPAARRIPSEGPQHRVRISRPFYLGKNEVTQAQWQAVMGDNPSKFTASVDHPAESMGREEIGAFVQALNKRAESVKISFHLPSEAQWEYACRAGTTTIWHSGGSEDELLEYGWFRPNAERKTHPVGELKPNAFGLFDMHGNVFELCADWYDADYYTQSPVIDPSGPAEESLNLYRGGCWTWGAYAGRSAHRAHYNVPDNPPNPQNGFRLAASIDPTPKSSDSSEAVPQTPDEAAAAYVHSVGGHAYWKDNPRRLTNVQLLHCKDVTDEGLAVFRECKDLEWLNFEWTSATDHALAHFKNCKQLETLQIGPTTTDAALAYLTQFPNLKNLSLGARQGQISTEGLKHLRNCPKLTHVDTWWNTFTDDNIQEVKNWPHLESLSLKETKELTNKGLLALHDLKQLRELQITKTNKLSDKALNELRAALPDCEVAIDRFIMPARWIPHLTKEPTFAQWTIESDDGCQAEFEEDRLKVHSPDDDHEARIARYVETGGILLHVEMWKAHDGSASGVRFEFPKSTYIDLHARQKRELWREPPQGEARLEQSQPHAEDAQAGEWISTQYVLLDDEMTVYSQGKKVYSQPLLQTEMVKCQWCARN